MDIKDEFYEMLMKKFEVNCDKCFGFCCTALFFSKTDGFPEDKQAGKPCINLQNDFKCCVHADLAKKGLKGCITYECFGAGEKVAQNAYKGVSWRDDNQKAKEMFDSFVQMRNIYEMLWYLAEAYRIEENTKKKLEIKTIINETIKLTELNGEKLIKTDLVPYRIKINKALLQTSEEKRNQYKRIKKNKIKFKKQIAGRLNLIGSDLSKKDLCGENLSSALLISANLSNLDLSGVDFLGADLRDANFCGSNLENAIYLTQFQLNSAKGNKNTKLPVSLKYPSNWKK